MTPPAATHELLMPSGNLRRRRRVNRIVEISSTVAALLAVAVLLIVLGSVLLKGISALSISFLTDVPAGFGESGGGISSAIVGTAILVALASLIAIPLGLLVAIYTSEFAHARAGSAIRFALDVLNGVPTIITGIFIFGLLVVGHQQSALAGAVALSVVMLPIVARTAQEVLELVPGTLKEAAYALGVTRWRTVVRVVLPTAAAGLLTGALLGVARVAGETAPLLFTCSIFSPEVSTDISKGVASIPVLIFQYSESPNPENHAQAWAAALVLIAFVLALNIIARAFYSRARKRMES